MRIDSQLAFVPVGSPLSLIAADGVTIPSTNVIDLLGVGSGNASSNIIGNATVFGEDPGVGAMRPEILCVIGTTCTTGNGATLNLAVQYAIDNGSNAPGTWVTAEETGAIAIANLVSGKQIARLPLVPVQIDGQRPRFVRLLAQTPAAAHFTAGTIAFAVITFGRDDLNQKNAAKNYTVG